MPTRGVTIRAKVNGSRPSTATHDDPRAAQNLNIVDLACNLSGELPFSVILYPIPHRNL